MLRNMIRLARITKAGTDTGQFHTQQLEYLGKTANTLMVFPYGLHSNCTPDSSALMFSSQDNPEAKAAIAWTPKNRPQMASGEVTLYHPETNSIISWRKGGNLEITTEADIDATCANATIDCDNLTANVGSSVTLDAGSSVDITAPTMTLNGNLVVNGTMTNNGKDVGDTHGHDQDIDSDGNTEATINGVI